MLQVFGALEPPAEFDIILMDILMARTDGSTVCQELRKRGYEVPIVAMTGVSTLSHYFYLVVSCLVTFPSSLAVS